MNSDHGFYTFALLQEKLKKQELMKLEPYSMRNKHHILMNKHVHIKLFIAKITVHYDKMYKKRG